MKSTMMDFPLALPVVLERTGKLFPEVEIVSRRPDRSIHRYTYGDFHRRARALAEQLQRSGLRAGDRVAALLFNHHVYLEAYFGVPCCRCVLHALNFRLHPDEIAYIINHAEDRVLIVDETLLPAYEKFRDRVNLERVLVVSHGGDGPADYESYESFLSDATGDLEYPPIQETDGAALCYTSGTTGKPKGVLYSHRSIVLHSLIGAAADGLGLSQSDVVMPIQPLFHANGWGYPHAAVMFGSKMVFPGPHLDVDSLLDLLIGERVTLTGGVPTVWTNIVEKLEREPALGEYLSGLRLLCAGSAPSEALMRRLGAFGIRIIHGWGMTETSPAATLSRPKSYMGSLSDDERYALQLRQGYALPFVELRVRNGAEEVPWDGQTMGELEVRGPWIAAGYYNCPDEAGRWTSDGWFRTGDVVTIDREGYIRLTDRLKDLIKSGGEWISSVDVENTLVAHPAVREAAVIAVPHPLWVERPIAIVLLRPNAQATPEELRDFLLRRFSRWQLPDAFVFVNELPHTSVGKLLKSELRRQYHDWKWATVAEPARR